jgi:hypothetical protein
MSFKPFSLQTDWEFGFLMLRLSILLDRGEWRFKMKMEVGPMMKASKILNFSKPL